MLQDFFHNQWALGAAQAAASALLVLAVMLLARRRKIHLEREMIVALVRGLVQIEMNFAPANEREMIVALVRGLVQIVAVGSVFIVLLRRPAWTGMALLAGMIVAAARISAGRAKGIPGTFPVSLYAMAAGSGCVI